MTAANSCPLAALAAQLEAISARNELTESKPRAERGPEDLAILEAYDAEREAIAIRASYLTATSAVGCALQVALAWTDADVLVASTYSKETHQRMNRLFRQAVRYLETVGGALPSNVASYYTISPPDDADVAA
jgi:hypothetical protein